MRSCLRWLTVSVRLGLIAPSVFLLTTMLVARDSQLEAHFGYAVRRIMRIFWPSSIWLLAADPFEGTIQDYEILLWSIAGNMMLYGLIGMTAWLIKRVVTPATGLH